MTLNTTEHCTFIVASCEVVNESDVVAFVNQRADYRDVVTQKVGIGYDVKPLRNFKNKIFSNDPVSNFSRKPTSINHFQISGDFHHDLHQL